MTNSPVLLPTHLNKAKVFFRIFAKIACENIQNKQKKLLHAWIILPNIAKKTKNFVKIKCNSFKMKSIIEVYLSRSDFRE
jgi:hypothetical protein